MTDNTAFNKRYKFPQFNKEIRCAYTERNNTLMVNSIHLFKFTTGRGKMQPVKLHRMCVYLTFDFNFE